MKVFGKNFSLSFESIFIDKIFVNFLAWGKL